MWSLTRCSDTRPRIDSHTSGGTRALPTTEFAGYGSIGSWCEAADTEWGVPTRLNYDEALDEALCYGWIDGQKGARDQTTFRQRFTPRRNRSAWSKRNVGLVERLIAEDRMQPSGQSEIDRAKADGRWEAAYPGQATATVPDDLAAALAANPAAAAMFERLSGANRYAILYRIAVPKRAETRGRKIGEFVAMLARSETVHPQ